ncbi:hypothetical protein B0H14DRAFT_2570129 [Mycena olivaceomarginata]|nr:hypothetical protein B0H14DRAFT_2570129 [Mycena olivaceomarginata]
MVVLNLDGKPPAQLFEIDIKMSSIDLFDSRQWTSLSVYRYSRIRVVQAYRPFHLHVIQPILQIRPELIENRRWQSPEQTTQYNLVIFKAAVARLKAPINSFRMSLCSGISVEKRMRNEERKWGHQMFLFKKKTATTVINCAKNCQRKTTKLHPTATHSHLQVDGIPHAAVPDLKVLKNEFMERYGSSLGPRARPMHIIILFPPRTRGGPMEGIILSTLP